MICFVRRSTIDYDVRLKKYVDSCILSDVDFIAITWDRQLNCAHRYVNEYQYCRKAPYGGGFKNSVSIVGWLFFLYYHLFRFWKKYHVIHACNIEIMLFVLPLKLFGKKIVFDVYDSVNTKIERFVSRFADVLILPHERRLEQIGVKKEDLKHFLVVENVPQIDVVLPQKDQVAFPEYYKLAYVGVLERNIRGLENLLAMVEDDRRLILNIAGIGGGLENLVQEYADRCDRIHYHGKVSYQKALEIMNASDFIVALYYSSHVLHKYASPNKFYESLFLSKPIITSKNTLVGMQVEEADTGYTIDDDIDSFKNLFHTITREDYFKKKANCGNLWKSKYENYIHNVLGGEYISLMKNI